MRFLGIGLKIILGLGAVSLVAACSQKKTELTGASCGFNQNVYGQRVSWKDSLPIKIYVHKSFPEEFIPALEKAMASWEQAAGRTLFRLAGTGVQAQGNQDGLNVVSMESAWDANKSSEQARTTVYWIGDTIKEADIKINAAQDSRGQSYFNFYVDQPEPSRETNKNIHMESLLLHELGHFLGLKHKDQEPSVMATYLAGQTDRSQLFEQDATDLGCEY